MTNWKVAPSYKNAKILSVDETTRKAHIEETCDRCGGSGIIASRVENGHIIPIPVDNGVCYKCLGTGKISKWVKAYTEEEMEKYLSSQERAKAKRLEKAKQEEQEKLNKSKENEEKLLVQLGYDAKNPLIWLVGGGSTFKIKDELKAQGCKFCSELGWYNTHACEVPDGYGLVSINFYDVYTWSPFSKRFTLNDNAKEVAEAALLPLEPKSTSEFIGEVKERVRDLAVSVSDIYTFEGFYGATTIYTFDYNGNVLVWMTSSHKDIQVGDNLLLTGTIKDNKVYKGIKQTYLSRCIFKVNN